MATSSMLTTLSLPMPAGQVFAVEQGHPRPRLPSWSDLLGALRVTRYDQNGSEQKDGHGVFAWLHGFAFFGHQRSEGIASVWRVGESQSIYPMFTEFASVDTLRKLMVYAGSRRKNGSTNRTHEAIPAWRIGVSKVSRPMRVRADRN